jgi:hypothetical protein
VENIMSEQDFIREMLDRTAHIEPLVEGVKGINSHLARLNGSVADQYRQMMDLKLELVEHARDCPIKDQIIAIDGKVNDMKLELESGNHPGSKDVREALETFNLNVAKKESAQTAREQTDSKWWKELKPYILVAGGAVAYIVLKHLGDALAAWGIKP